MQRPQVLQGLILHKGVRRRAQLSTPHIGGRTAADPLAEGSSRRTPHQWFHPTLSLPKPIPAPPPIPPALGILCIAGPTAPQTAIKPCSERPPRRCIAPGRHRLYIHRLRKRPPRRCTARRGGTAIRLKQRPGTYMHMVMCTYIRSPSVHIRLVSKALASSLPILPEK